MTQRERAEEQIRELLVTETSGITLSNRLFAPEGLFAQLADTEDERRAVTQTPLFRQAQTRLSELQRKEAAEFAWVVQQVQASTSGEGYSFEVERTEKP